MSVHNISSREKLLRGFKGFISKLNYSAIKNTYDLLKKVLKSAQMTTQIVTNVTVENVTYATVTYLDFVNSGFDLDLLSIVYNRDYP